MKETNQENTLLFEQNYEELCKLVCETTDVNLLSEFLHCLFTPAERQDFAKRWIIVKELNKGVTQREIAKKFNMSLCKITRASKELKKQDSAFVKMLKKLEK